MKYACTDAEMLGEMLTSNVSDLKMTMLPADAQSYGMYKSWGLVSYNTFVLGNATPRPMTIRMIFCISRATNQKLRQLHHLNS